MERTLAEYISHAPVFVRTLDGRIIHWSQGAEELFGYTAGEAKGRDAFELLKAELPAPLDQLNSTLVESGRWQGVLRHTTKDGSTIFTESQWRLRARDQEPLVVVLNTDVTQREFLARELAHRVKNILSVVQGLARFSLGGADKDDLDRFEQRLKALAEANDLLVRHQWISANLDELLVSTLERAGVADRVSMAGPPVTLSPNSVIAYSLAFHELTTNALKYGALSRPEGRIEVTWSHADEDGDHLHLVWRETGGPPVTPPSRKGFGSRLIDNAVTAELGSPVEFHFEPDGLVCVLNGRMEKRRPLEEEPDLAG